MELGSAQVQAFLAQHFDARSADVLPVGAGAWSECFGFRRGEQALVVRFGKHVDDFEKDELAFRYHTPDLPVPQVLAIGPAFDGYYAVSTRVYGVALESVAAGQWLSLVPSLAAALEAIRTADISATAGFGGWDGRGAAVLGSWSAYLLAVNDDTPDHRTYGWRERLSRMSGADAVFTWGMERLTQLANVPVTRSLIHGDLINRNVLVDGPAITGVFDWGCGCYGDHLYELAWFEFWSSWYPELSMQALRDELERRWSAAGYVPRDRDDRLMASYLHIGLAHLAYNAHLGDAAALAATAERMRALVR